ncbi:DUF2510 domain-containing protein [Microbacterium sp. 10M-3C3]|jgi:hypothetical protein|uniref:DUF2510 domain-containing protein n=1 Tax=Microbacterium sp. 10M-3C3 TaxID=2483401 RepID=UPI0013DD8DAC|nr:DUF2510 domain-containing protein [Microbacterium sp. 10M-3C3]
MTSPSSTPPGWYPDTERPGGERWWNGLAWTDDRRGGAASGFAAPTAPAATPAYPGYPAYPAYPSAPAASGEQVARRDIPTGTVWIWLVIFAPVVTVLPLFFFDWEGYLRDVIVQAAQDPQGVSPFAATPFEAGLLGFSVFQYVVAGLQVLFAWLDWRALKARGIVKPFHWAWSFFTFVVSNGVYVIGRGIVLRRQTGSGLGPVWAWIALTVASVIAGVVFAAYLMNFVFTVMVPYIEQYSTTL